MFKNKMTDEDVQKLLASYRTEIANREKELSVLNTIVELFEASLAASQMSENHVEE